MLSENSPSKFQAEHQLTWEPLVKVSDFNVQNNKNKSAEAALPQIMEFICHLKFIQKSC